MRYAIRGLGALASLAALASCGSIDGKNDNGGLESASSIERSGSAPVGVTDDVVKIGNPYTVGNISYVPVDSATYDEVGYASYYGSERAGQATANGEIFNPAGASAAHKTLPMPSYVEVTALDTGRTILVRINDRGPFANDRLIDLSEGAARQLGLGPKGVTGVRVRRVNPPEQEKSVLRQGLTAAERIETPGPLLKVLRDKLAKQPASAAELDKIKRRIRSSFVFGLQTNLSRATRLGEYESYYGDARLLARELAHYQAVTAEDIQKAVQKYLTNARRQVVEVVPAEAPAAPSAPPAAKAPPAKGAKQ